MPRDFIKIGQLMLNGGTWRGERILSEEYVKRASGRLYHLRRIYYGYLWWGIDLPYKDRTIHAYFAGGNGGQGTFVIPELDLVIGTWGGNYASRVTFFLQQEVIPNYILPAVREEGDDPEAPVMVGTYETIYGPSDETGPVAPEDQ